MAPRRSRKRAREETEREEEFLKKKQKALAFRSNAFLIITEMLKLNAQHPTVFLDEILHSIFFLWKLDDPDFSPERIEGDDGGVGLLSWLEECCPRPFEFYSSHLPKRTPFSCVMDTIVHMCGQTIDEKEIIKKLQEFIAELERGQSKNLVSSTVCVSQSNILKYYGVSMSTSGPYPGRIMVAASCLSSWDRYVADAVMTYYSTQTKKPQFDGTIRLPPRVRCQAFNICGGREMPPCRSCGNLFGLETRETQEFPYGNCAEAECLSNLFKSDEEVRKQVRPTSETCTDENREAVKQSVLSELRRLLRLQKFQWANDEAFYEPGV